jgi:prophage DNA circulation protein
VGIEIPNPKHGWEGTVGCRPWLIDQNIASFKDVPFAVDTDSRSGGRRIHIHEYPARESWDNEDMGRLRQEVQVAAYVYGDSSDLWAEELFAACTDASVNILRLPMRTPANARCLTVESTFSANAMGRIEFAMRFVLETGRERGLVPSVVKSATQLVGAVNKASNEVFNQARSLFEEDFTGNTPNVGRIDAAVMMKKVAFQVNYAAQASQLTSAAATQVKFLVQRISTLANDLVIAQRAIPNTLTSTAAVNSQTKSIIPKAPTTWVNQGLSLRTSTGQVVPATATTEEGFGGLLAQALKTLSDGVKNPADLSQALYGLSKLKPIDIVQRMASSQTTSAVSQYQMAETVAGYARRMAMAQIALSGSQVSPERQPDASLSRRRLLDTIDDELALAAASADMYRAIRHLRSAVVEFVGHWSQGGSATRPVSSRGIMPLAVIAANLYNSTERDSQLMDFNGVRHPLFPPATLSALK